MIEWKVTRQLSVRVTPLLYLIFLLLYLHNIACQKFGPFVMYISKSTQGSQLSFWTRVRFGIIIIIYDYLGLGFCVGV